MCSAIPHAYYQILKMEVMIQCRTNLIDMIDLMNIEDNSNPLDWSLMDMVLRRSLNCVKLVDLVLTNTLLKDTVLKDEMNHSRDGTT